MSAIEHPISLQGILGGLVKIRSLWLIRLSALLGALLVRAWLSTVKAKMWLANGQAHPTNPDVKRFIYIFWHESLLAPAKIKTKAKIMVSQSADGELIARVCNHLGIGVVRGSTTRGAEAGLLDLLHGGQNTHLALTPDGPRGPRRHLQPGVVFLASRTGLPIVPVGVGFTRAWRAKSWDRFVIPLPFSTMTGVLGEPINVPPQIDGGDLEYYRARVEASLLWATHAAENWAEKLVA
jgi:lysophospholipid acyltransferase (LPLAT)-like uncharacterized protein